MDNYTYSSIIIDPTKEGIENLIGKEVYFHDNPSFCVVNANRKSNDNLGILVEICEVSINPFLIKKDDGIVHAYPCIIPKEPILKYVPFESSKEFMERYKEAIEGFDFGSLDDDHSQDNMWLKRKNIETDVYCMVAGICNNMVDICNKKTTILGEVIFIKRLTLCELYHKYIFPDGSPCGRLKESE